VTEIVRFTSLRKYAMTTQSGSKNIRPIKENFAAYRSRFMNAAAGRNNCNKLATFPVGWGRCARRPVN